jgi:histidinol-phosphate aminotransferase
VIEKLIRPHLRTFKPYVSARSEVLDARVFLDANELPVMNPVGDGGMGLNRYPDPFQIELRKTIATGLAVDPEKIFTGVGSDEIIDLLIRLFCEPTLDSIAIVEPTYGVYRVAANVNAVRTTTIELDGQFQIDLASTLTSIRPDTKLIFLCSPNNPTGNALKREDILSLCRKTSALVIVDQAYVEFANASDDLAHNVGELENLVVLRTFSKAWGLAGVRLGYCIAHPQIVSYLLRIKSPYNVSAVTSRLGLAALKNRDFLVNAAATIIEERDHLATTLKLLPCVVKVYPSDANFLLVEFQDAHRVFEILRRAGIIVRRRSEPRLANCLRLTVGTREENELLLSEIRTKA